jgi:hypothetical protein
MGSHKKFSARKSLGFGAVAVLAAGVISSSPLIAGASGGEISLYLSAPYVQGSHVSGAGVSRESFDSLSTGTRNSETIAMGTMSTASGTFQIENAGDYGGAWVGPDVSAPSKASGSDETGTRYVSNQDNEVSISLTSSAKYVGLWWSAGNSVSTCSSCNTIKFFSGAAEVMSMNEAQVASVLAQTNVSRVDGGTHPSANYRGNPKKVAAASPDENFAYLNLFISGGQSIDRIVLSGNGFEFDNVVTATSEFAPTASMVFITSQQGSWPTPSPVMAAIDVNPTNITVDNEIISILGANLNTVTDVFIGGISVPIFTQTGNRLQVRAPKGLSGFVDLELKSSLNDVLLPKKLNFGGTATAGTRKATLVVGGFAPNSRKLTARMQARIDRWLERNSDLGTLTCTGFTSLPRRTTDVTLSTNRGKTACNFSKRQRADLETSVSQGIEDPRPGSNVRRVKLVLTP